MERGMGGWEFPRNCQIDRLIQVLYYERHQGAVLPGLWET